MTAIKPSKNGKKHKGRGQFSTYDETVPVRCYEFLIQGYSLVKCATMFDVSSTTFFAWMNKHAALKDAVERGQSHKRGEGTATFRDYVFGRLSKEARKIWKRIHRFERVRKENKIKALLERKGKHMRQQLFFHAIIASNFNISLALRKICLSHSQYQAWMQNDADFARLVRELDFHKGNYFESALMKLIRDGDSAATIFACKTFLRDRGYNEKVDFDVKVQHTIANPLNEMLAALPVEDRIKIQQHLRQKKLDAQAGRVAAEDPDIKEIVDYSKP